MIMNFTDVRRNYFDQIINLYMGWKFDRYIVTLLFQKVTNFFVILIISLILFCSEI